MTVEPASHVLSKLIRYYTEGNPSTRAYLRAIVFWARGYGLINSKADLMNSISVILMALHAALMTNHLPMPPRGILDLCQRLDLPDEPTGEISTLSYADSALETNRMVLDFFRYFNGIFFPSSPAIKIVNEPLLESPYAEPGGKAATPLRVIDPVTGRAVSRAINEFNVVLYLNAAIEQTYRRLWDSNNQPRTLDLTPRMLGFHPAGNPLHPVPAPSKIILEGRSAVLAPADLPRRAPTPPAPAQPDAQGQLQQPPPAPAQPDVQQPAPGQLPQPPQDPAPDADEPMEEDPASRS